MKIELTINIESGLEQRAILDVLGGLNERLRQVREKGYTADHDDSYVDDELAMAAISYAYPADLRKFYSFESPQTWPWSEKSWKPSPNDRCRELDKAIALLLAEKARIKRLEEKEVNNG